MANAKTSRLYSPNVWIKRDLCPKCGAKPGERCQNQLNPFKRCTVPHPGRPLLPQYK